MADTLLTPLHDSFLDFGSLASSDPITHEIVDAGHYAAMYAKPASGGGSSIARSRTGWSFAIACH